MVERLKHTLCHLISHLIAKDRNSRDEQVLHAINSYCTGRRGDGENFRLDYLYMDQGGIDARSG